MIKTAFELTVAAVILTLLVWVFFYVATPEAPLGAGDTTIVAGAVLLLVIFVRWLWTLFRKKKESE